MNSSNVILMHLPDQQLYVNILGMFFHLHSFVHNTKFKPASHLAMLSIQIGENFLGRSEQWLQPNPFQKHISILSL